MNDRHFLRMLTAVIGLCFFAAATHWARTPREAALAFCSFLLGAWLEYKKALS